ncbi:MAG: hypothetical protein K6E49_01350 [Lachnospiraceae bacterium]|nr:hypothetical protein [Lachnospiraceae bacterium]
MKSMFFKNILIADVQKRTARFVSFKKGLNIVTSMDNHVGKSSVIKSLYNTLGADVKYDAKWDKDSKLSAVTLDVDGIEYRVVRFIKKYAIFRDHELLLLTDSVTHELAPKLSEIFDFSVYLAEKRGNKAVVQAPPAFSFMPYYIDQDKGWSELYDSFERIDQFAKNERAKSLYFHLGLYTKKRIELQAKKDELKEELTQLQERENQLLITIGALSEELSNIIPADNEKELEQYLSTPKKEIEDLVQRIGHVRNRIQELQTSLEQHLNQLDIIRQFQQIKTAKMNEPKTIHTCPQCGYEFDDDLYKLIRSNYNQSNAEYLKAQIDLIVNNIRLELQTQEHYYVDLMSQLKEKEEVYDESQNAYDAYLRHRGLKETLRKYQLDLGKNKIEQSDREDAINEINKELQIIPNKKDVEETYINFVKQNTMTLGVWAQEYEGNIKLLKSLNAQGSLMPKIILSQYIGLFQTMDQMNNNVIRFPFVVDSPRNMESSTSSSKEILTMIASITSLPQVIVATVDYDEFKIKDGGNANKIYFTDQFKVLNEDSYLEWSEDIEGLYQLMTDKGRI